MDAILAGGQPHSDRPAAAVLHGIRQEIHHHLLDAQPVPADHDLGWRLDLDVRPGRRRRLAEIVRRLPHERSEIEALGGELQPSAGDPRNVQQALDEPRQPLDLPKGSFEARSHHGRARLGRGTRPEHTIEPLHLELQRGEGRAKLMRGDRDELVPLAQRFSRLCRPDALLLGLLIGAT